jgi:hypothetical protein
VFSRTRLGGIRPITIGRRVVEEMDTLSADGQSPLPHAYTVHVNPTDYELLAPAIKPLLSELRQAITNHATYEQYQLGSDAVAAIVSDEAIARGKCNVVATSPEPAQHHAPVAVAENTYFLVLPDGTHQQLTQDDITIGRSSTCTVVIADTNVSRVHAQLRLVDGTWTIEDRGSTNGTRVNKETITAAVQLVGGEEIAFGALVVRFEKA